MLGSEEGVTNKNILQYMGIIEQRTMELVQLQQYIQMKVILNLHEKFISYTVGLLLNPTAIRKAKIVYNFGLSECNRVK